MVLGGVLLGTLLVFSGIVSFIFTIPLILFENLKVTRALSRSGELVSPFWGYVVGIYIFCVLTYILNQCAYRVVPAFFWCVYGAGGQWRI